MPALKLCLSCGKSLAGYRRHAHTCGSTCRGIIWRTNRVANVSVTLALSCAHFETIKSAADHHGVTVTNYIINRSIGYEISSTNQPTNTL